MASISTRTRNAVLDGETLKIAGRKQRISKYLDSDRTVVNPQWLRENTRLREEAATVHTSYWGRPGQHDRYFPGAYGKAIPTEGAWILVTDPPHTELDDRFEVPQLSLWRAMPHQSNAGAITITVENNALTFKPQQALIITPGGALHLWPHEYIVCHNPRTLVSDPSTTLHSLGGQPVIDEQQLFYLQSRGISRDDALLMLFDLITGQQYVYATLHPDLVAMFAGVGTSLRSHIANNPRRPRAAAVSLLSCP